MLPIKYGTDNSSTGWSSVGRELKSDARLFALPFQSLGLLFLLTVLHKYIRSPVKSDEITTVWGKKIQEFRKLVLFVYYIVTYINCILKVLDDGEGAI